MNYHFLDGLFDGLNGVTKIDCVDKIRPSGVSLTNSEYTKLFEEFMRTSFPSSGTSNGNPYTYGLDIGIDWS